MSELGDVREAYLLSLRGLEVASIGVKEACEGEDINAAAMEAHFGLHAVYDLHEAYMRPRGLRKIEPQDDVYEREDGGVVAALVMARSGLTHKLVTFASPGGYGDVPYGMGPYGGGWLWREHQRSEPDFARRNTWYESRVQWRYLCQPLDEAWLWFSKRAPAA